MNDCPKFEGPGPKSPLACGFVGSPLGGRLRLTFGFVIARVSVLPPPAVIGLTAVGGSVCIFGEAHWSVLSTQSRMERAATAYET